MKFAKGSIALLILQLIIVSSVAAKYLYERVTCPRVWTRAAAFDPSLVMRGRYLSLRLTVDGCGSTLPSAKNAQFPRTVDGVPTGQTFNVNSSQAVWFQAKLAVRDNRLTVTRVPDSGSTAGTQSVSAPPGAPCNQMRLADPVDFYIPEHANDPSWLKSGQELWIEVTVPPKGPPRPLQLALKENGAWKPLAFQ
ncbi:MAG TPA: hypothetical protein VGI45_07615 [Terracidiphilus sp.]|jgi:hypothetical protein